MGQFSNRVVLVTGGSSGIGRATAKAFAHEAATVVIAARSVAESEAVVQAIKEEGGNASFIQADVTKEVDVQHLIEQIVTSHGHLDVAFNNASMVSGIGPLTMQTEAVWDEAMHSLLKSVFLCMKHEITQMLKQGKGAIVNNASTAGSIGLPYAAIYTAAKHGVLGLTRAAGLEYAKAGIRVNAVQPGVVDTPQFRSTMGATPEQVAQIVATLPMGRLESSEEIAGAVLFLASDAASSITGAVLAVDGAYTTQ